VTDETLTRILTLFSEAYRMEFSAEGVKTWRVLVGALPDEAAIASAIVLCRTSSYPPRPADLIRLVEGSPDADAEIEVLAARAERHLQEHLCDYKFNNFWPLLNAVVRDMGGVDAVIMLLDSGQWRFERARFKALLKVYSRGPISAEAGAVLVPQAVAAGLLVFPIEQYAAQSLPVPMVDAPFLPTPPTQPALPRGEVTT
jgi:hypothetical protein